MTTMSTRSILAAAAKIAFLAVANIPALVNADPEALVNADPGHPDSMQVIFVNEFPSEVIDLYWEDHFREDDQPTRRFEAHIPPRGGWHRSMTYQGHEFSYEFNGQRHYVNPPPGNIHGEQFIILAGDSEGYRVRCDITVQSQKSTDALDILVKPYWAPRGAARFLELVRSHYYDGAAFHSVVPGGVAQFGIAKDFATREKEQKFTIWDDFQKEGLTFEPGMLSFAGTGFDSRSTEVFVVMPGASQEQTAKLGENTWETPFAQIYGDVNTSALNQIYSGYGKGPDPSKIYEEDGYTNYLAKKDFAKLDYINKCYILDEIADGLSEGEL